MAGSEDFFIGTTAQDFSEMLHRVIGNTFIVEYGIVKEVKADGVVAVEMSVAESAEDIVITDCVLANVSSSEVTVNVKPSVDDKVLVLFPRMFNNDMFSKANNEAILNDSPFGYNVMGGIAFLVNQYQDTDHKNVIDFSDGSLSVKMAYSEDEKKNLFNLTVNADGEVTVQSNKSVLSIDKEGNVTVEAQGKYTIKNGSTDLKQVVDGLATELENLTTVGSPSTQSTSPASKSTIATWRSGKLNQLFS